MDQLNANSAVEVSTMSDADLDRDLAVFYAIVWVERFDIACSAGLDEDTAARLAGESVVRQQAITEDIRGMYETALAVAQ